MARTYLLLGSLLEIGWAVSIKYANGFTILLPSLLTAASSGMKPFS